MTTQEENAAWDALMHSLRTIDYFTDKIRELVRERRITTYPLTPGPRHLAWLVAGAGEETEYMLKLVECLEKSAETP